MSLEEQRLKEIKKIILEHKGKLSAINAREIANMLDIPDNDRFSITRGLITKLIRDEELPIGAYENGYFLIENQQELNEYMQRLNYRIIGITNRKARLISNFEKYYGKPFSDTEEFDEGDDEDFI